MAEGGETLVALGALPSCLTRDGGPCMRDGGGIEKNGALNTGFPSSILQIRARAISSGAPSGDAREAFPMPAPRIPGAAS